MFKLGYIWQLEIIYSRIRYTSSHRVTRRLRARVILRARVSVRNVSLRARVRERNFSLRVSVRNVSLRARVSVRNVSLRAWQVNVRNVILRNPQVRHCQTRRTFSHSHSPCHTHTQARKIPFSNSLHQLTLTLSTSHSHWPFPKKLLGQKTWIRLELEVTTVVVCNCMLNTWYYDILYPNTKLLQVIDLDPHCIHKHCGFFLMKNPEYVCVGKKLSNVIWIF